MRILFISICRVLIFAGVLLCTTPVPGETTPGLQVIEVEGSLLDSDGNPVNMYDMLRPGSGYRLLPQTDVLLATLDGKKTYRATGSGKLVMTRSGLVLLNGKALAAKDQNAMLQGVTAQTPGQQLAGVSLRQLQVVPDEEKRSSIHEVNGYAYLGENTTPRQARSEALATAKRQALEMARVRLESNTLVKNGKLQYDFIKSGAKGVVTVLEQKDHGFRDNRYHVWIRAEVKYDLKPVKKNQEKAQTLFNEGPLTVKVWTPRKQYHRGEKVVVHIMGSRDFYARIVNEDAKGNMTQLLPNDYRSNSRFKGGVIYRVPGEGDRFAIQVMDNLGEEKIVVYASEVPLGEVNTTPAGAGLRGYGGTRDQMGRDVRAIKVVSMGARPESGAEFYEATWKFTTTP
ncbi:MAG: hypothetical protein B6240_01305 [Desulfobacteraceae bacterium 4572_87]|nr:MAG: hypothetical protein B6240_01305 [Desulfobacteraceae bacterium 4572_87]